MSRALSTPQDAEDAYYDAIDEGDLEAMMAVWDGSVEVACLLPMQPLHVGIGAVRAAWQRMLGAEVRVVIAVHHRQWIEWGDVAIHLVEEEATVSGHPPQPPIYATNVFRRTDKGWRIVYHGNAPTPPPPGMLPPAL